MARLIWKGSLRFGLVDVAVGLRPAVAAKELKFTYLDSKDLSPVGYERINKATGAKVAWDRIVRGYKHKSGDYVVVGDEDLKSANVEATQSVDIVTFVNEDVIDPVYFDKPYYLVPIGKRTKSYVLLRKALEKSGKVGIGRVVIKTRQHLAAVSPKDSLLLLEILRFDHEILKPKELDIPSETLTAKVDEKELQMAMRLIEELAGPWEPRAFKDDYRDDVLALIEDKVRSGDLTSIRTAPVPKKARGGTVVDLMPLLKRSLELAAKGPTTVRRPPSPAQRAAGGGKTSRRRAAAPVASPRAAKRRPAHRKGAA